LDYNILYFVFLNKNEPASKKVGIDAIPTINSQSRAEMGRVWKIGHSGG
jgi:hypothetical protein